MQYSGHTRIHRRDELSGQRSEVRGQKSEVREQREEVRSQKSEEENAPQKHRGHRGAVSTFSGRRAREKVDREFDARVVAGRYRQLYQEVLSD